MREGAKIGPRGRSHAACSVLVYHARRLNFNGSRKTSAVRLFFRPGDHHHDVSLRVVNPRRGRFFRLRGEAARRRARIARAQPTGRANDTAPRPAKRKIRERRRNDPDRPRQQPRAAKEKCPWPLPNVSWSIVPARTVPAWRRTGRQLTPPSALVARIRSVAASRQFRLNASRGFGTRSQWLQTVGSTGTSYSYGGPGCHEPSEFTLSDATFP